ncbi:MAG: RNA polymerase sigma factor [Bacteroidota bacterium]
MHPPADQELLVNIAAGDAAALRHLYDRHASRVYNTAISYLQREVEAEEVTQDVFTKVWRSAGTFKGNSEVTTWLYRIAVNTSLSALRKRKKRNIFSAFGDRELSPPDFDHPGALLEDREETKSLFAAIYRLPDRQKTAFILSYVEEIPRSQVAEIMGNTLKAVESLLIRAKAGLRKQLKANHPHRGINR